MHTKGLTDVSRADATHVLWAFGDDRSPAPGGFFRSLLDALGKADPRNYERLREGFPGLVAAHEHACMVPGGLDDLRRVTEKPPVTEQDR